MLLPSPIPGATQTGKGITVVVLAKRFTQVAVHTQHTLAEGVYWTEPEIRQTHTHTLHPNVVAAPLK